MTDYVSKWLKQARVGLAGGVIATMLAASGGEAAQTAAGQTAPGQTTPGQSTPGQAAPDQTAPEAAILQAGGLNIPADSQILGKFDPNVRKPTAIVNSVVITGTDVDQRVALLISANQLTNLNAQETLQLRLQVLRQLIDETLQIQEAAANKITVGAPEIDQGFGRVAANFSKSADDMRIYLRSIGSSERSMRRQIEGELAWSRYLRRNVDINVGEEEVQRVIDSLKARKGTEEYHLKEIYLSAGPDRAPQVLQQEREMIQQMQKGDKPFEYFAQFSEASTRRTGGDLDWLSEAQLAQLPDAMVSAAREMKVGQVAGPIEIPGGFSVLYLVDKRKVLEADPRDAKLTLKQVSVKFAAGTSEADSHARLQAFASQTEKIKGCGDVAKVANAMGAEVVDAQVKVRDLPVPLQSIMLQLQVGQSTPPFGSTQEGVRALVLCGRDDPQGGSLPSADQIQSQMEQQRVNLRAQQLLRDLRRDAVVEYR